jgi:hypothetical protein
MAAELGTRSAGRWARAGVGSLSPAAGHAALDTLLDCDESQVGVIPLDTSRWAASGSSPADSPYLSELSGSAGRARPEREQAPLRALVAAAAPGERGGLVRAALVSELARALRAEPGDIDTSTAFSELGLDYLVGMDFLNALEDQLGITLAEGGDRLGVPLVERRGKRLRRLADRRLAARRGIAGRLGRGRLGSLLRGSGVLRECVSSGPDDQQQRRQNRQMSVLHGGFSQDACGADDRRPSDKRKYPTKRAGKKAWDGTFIGELTFRAAFDPAVFPVYTIG